MSGFWNTLNGILGVLDEEEKNASYNPRLPVRNGPSWPEAAKLDDLVYRYDRPHPEDRVVLFGADDAAPPQQSR